MNSTFTSLSRIILGLILIVFGANKFLVFIPLPELQGIAGDFLSSLAATGYMLPIIGAIEIAIGFLLLFKKWIGFALTALVPISVNIVLFHLFLDLPGIGIAIVIAALNGILLSVHWRKFQMLFD